MERYYLYQSYLFICHSLPLASCIILTMSLACCLPACKGVKVLRALTDRKHAKQGLYYMPSAAFILVPHFSQALCSFCYRGMSNLPRPKRAASKRG